MNEYLYGDTLRWSFGFESPNKAAVIFACLLPLAWWGWICSWRIRRTVPKIVALLLSAGGVLAVGICLVMTFSRGGLVAAIIALAYLGWTAWQRPAEGGNRRRFRGPECQASFLLLVVLSGFGFWSGLAERSASGMADDASVTNRLSLWRSALQMAYENPAGFGGGKSGSEFMQWYQDPDRNEGYRTMVNSYLTLLVERGWVIFGGCLFLLVLVWRASLDDCIGGMAALKASILAFLVSGFFSTTMEAGLLWIIPGLCMAAILFLRTRNHSAWNPVTSLALTLGILGIAWGVGWHLSSRDPITRRFASVGGPVSSVSCREPRGVIALHPDPAVLGDQYGKLARALAGNAGADVHLGASGEADLILATGGKCFASLLPDLTPQIWVAPPVPSAEAVRDADLRNLTVLVPEMDEDGRSEWWKNQKSVKIIPLEGVGMRVDWAWDTIVQIAKAKLAASNGKR